MPPRPSLVLAALALSAGSLVACSDCGSQPAARARATGATGTTAEARGALVRYTVRPSATDPAIGDPDDEHHVCLTESGPYNGKLLVFLPGTNGKPANATRFLEEAARAGYHAVGLDYPDEDSANQVCRDDLDCYEGLRRAVFEGGGPNAPVSVSAANSIKNRLVKLLSWLHRSHPDEGWGAFLAGKDLQYESLALAGLSQGGGHAAYIAKGHRVARVIMFSSVCDADSSNPPRAATWVSAPHATPVDRYYGFDHTEDMFAEKIKATWPALGMDRLGPRTPVDGAKAPYGGSHQLITSVPEPSPKKAHGCVVADGSTPMRQGQPVFRDVWRYLLGG